MSKKRNEIRWAEDAPYWKTGRTAPDNKLDDAARLVTALGGVITARGYLEEPGRSAFLLSFTFDSENFKVLWPVLPSKKGEVIAARVQAATFLFHSVKAKSLDAVVLGVRAAFAANLITSSGRTVAELTTPAIADAIPPRLTQATED